MVFVFEEGGTLDVIDKEAVALKANKYFKTLDEIASHVASRQRVAEKGVDTHGKSLGFE